MWQKDQSKALISEFIGQMVQMYRLLEPNQILPELNWLFLDLIWDLF